jgi:hypothetical protein
MISLRLIPERFRSQAVCRYFIRRSIHNTQWIPRRVLMDMTFKLWLGVHTSAFRGGKLIKAPKVFSDGLSSIRSSLLISMAGFGFEQYSVLLGDEWLDDIVINQLIELNPHAYLQIQPKKLSEESIGFQLCQHKESIKELRAHVGYVNWENIVLKNRRAIIPMSADMLLDFDIDKVLMRKPSIALVLQKSQVDDRILRSVVRHCMLSDMGDAIFSNDNFLIELENSDRPFIKDKDAINVVLSFLIDQSDGLIKLNTLSFLSAHRERLFSHDRSIIDKVINNGIERHRKFSREGLSQLQILFEVISESRRAEAFAADASKAKYMFGDEVAYELPVLIKFLLQDKSLDAVIAEIESTRDNWLSLISIYPRAAILNYPEGRRYILEHEMGM